MDYLFLYYNNYVASVKSNSCLFSCSSHKFSLGTQGTKNFYFHEREKIESTMTIEKNTLMGTEDPSILQYSDMAADLERQELEANGGIATAQVYGQLLAIYLLQNDLPNAKFLWKRIPQNIKDENVELGKLWIVGQKLWQCESDIYQALAEEWPDHLKSIISAIRDVTRNRALRLVSKAYSSITIEKVSSFLGLSAEESIEALSSLGWEVDSTAKIVKPKSNDCKQEDCFQSEEQLAKLTDFVAFLEN